MSSVRQKIEELRAQLRYHDVQYYVHNAPEISDRAYDALMAELRALEEAHPAYITPDSPTQRVGEKPVAGFTSVTRTVPMLSIDNTYSYEDLAAFDARVRSSVSGASVTYAVEPKYDGLAMELVYHDRVFVQAVTRGDGTTGDDVTVTVRTVRSVPLQLADDAPGGEIRVRGEVCMPREEFIRLNEAREAAGQPLFANPRNAAAGSIKVHDPRVTAERGLAFICYGADGAYGSATHSSLLDAIVSWGIPVSTPRYVCQTWEEVRDTCEVWKSQRHSFPYDTDGMVIKVNDYSLQAMLGMTSKYPRWAIAYKFAAEQALTQINEIVFSVGRTGQITPIAHFTPVHLAGTTVARAQLHNFDEIARKDIRVGDWVHVEKAGEIIPYVVAVEKEKRTGNEKPTEPPATCPSCGEAVFRPPESPFIYCDNIHCPALVAASIVHFASRDAMDIEGLGPAVVELLLSANLVKDYGDLYTLTDAQLAGLPRMGSTSSLKLVDAIARSVTADAARVLYALGIKHVGVSTAKRLIAAFHSVDAVAAADNIALENVEDIGPACAVSIRHFFSQERHRMILDKLRAAGVRLSDEGRSLSSDVPQVFADKNFVLTGTLPLVTRADATAYIEARGGRVTGQVSGTTDYVVAGDSPGSKIDKARENGISILTWEEVCEMAGDIQKNGAHLEQKSTEELSVSGELFTL